jgi:hypothetical protein
LFVALATISVSLVHAQGTPDPQAELKKLQQSVKSVQATNAQLRFQLNEQKKAGEAFRQELNSMNQTLAGRDSLLNATRDSLTVISSKSEEAIGKTSRTRTILLFNQAMVIICLLLILTILFLLLKLKREQRKMREKMEANRDRLDNRITQVSGTLEEEIKKIREEENRHISGLEQKLRESGDNLRSEIGQNKSLSETRINEISGTLNQRIDDLKRDAEAGQAGLAQQLTDLDNKGKTALGALKAELQNTIHDIRGAVEKVSSSLQAIAKHPKHSGNSAE